VRKRSSSKQGLGKEIRDLSSVRCIKYDDDRVLIEDTNCKRDGEVISISSSIGRGLTPPNTMSSWLRKSNQTLGPVDISPEMSLRRH